MLLRFSPVTICQYGRDEREDIEKVSKIERATSDEITVSVEYPFVRFAVMLFAGSLATRDFFPHG